MSDKNLLLQDDAFAPASPDTLENLPSHHCAKPVIDPRFAAAHYGNDLKESPACGACPGDGSICATSRKVAEESPPVDAPDIKARLRLYATDDGFDSVFLTCNAPKSELIEAACHIESAESKIAMLESEAEQLRMSVHNARIEIGESEKDAARFNWVLPILTGGSADQTGDLRAIHLGNALALGLDGVEAIDAAMTKDAA